MKICMFVTNNCKYDTRVLKEAKTLTNAGHDVRIIAILDKETELYEERDGFRIIRITRNPVHFRLLNAIRLRPVSSFSVAGAPLGVFYLWISRPFKLVIQSVRQSLDKIYLLAKQSLKSVAERLKKPLRVVYWPAKRFKKPAYRLFRRVYRPIRRSLKLAYRPIRRLFRRVYRPIRRLLKLAYRPIRRLFRRIYRPANRFLYMRLRSLFMVFHRPLSLIDYYVRSWEAIKNEPADVYHSHDLNTLPIGYFARRKLGGKLVYDAHELFTEILGLGFFERRIFRFIERCLIGRADRVITVNNSIAVQLSKRYGIELPQVVMNCPPRGQILRHPSVSSLRKRLGLNKETPIILYHGGFGPGRGLENIILSAAYLNEGKIVLMGKGNLEQELRGLVKNNGLEGRVLFAEPVLPDEVAGQVVEANIGVPLTRNVCLNNYYSTSNKFFDYINAGLPVVTSDFPELKRITEGFHLGKTCNPEDPQDIAAAINWVLADKERYKELRTNAAEAAKIFNWENEAVKLISVYERLNNDNNVSAD